MELGLLNDLSRGWTKFFIDGGIEPGTDLLIEQGKASWRSGRLHDIVAVNIRENFYDYTLITTGDSEWWQGNEYHARYSTSNVSDPGKLVRRFTQFRIKEHHIGKHILLIPQLRKYKIILRDNPQGSLFQLTPKNIDQWLTMEVYPDLKQPSIKIKTNKG